jgi:hypothetical protein
MDPNATGLIVIELTFPEITATTDLSSEVETEIQYAVSTSGSLQLSHEGMAGVLRRIADTVEQHPEGNT